jgi:N4-gp56 family major capsid protein
MLAATASFINCVGGVDGDNPTEITRSDVDEVVRTLMTNNAYTIMDNIEGADKFGTAPVRDAYFGLCSTKMIGSLDAVSGFINKNQYPSPMNALASEWGSIGRIVADLKSFLIDLELCFGRQQGASVIAA